MKENEKQINKELCHIAQIKKLHDIFGEPFIQAFEKFKPQSHDEVLIASYTCSLFLSAIFYDFPTERLNIFVNSTKENYRRFSFNCKMYEEIFAHMNIEDLKAVVLLDKESNIVRKHCSKQDIFEAFDFYTNT